MAELKLQVQAETQKAQQDLKKLGTTIGGANRQIQAVGQSSQRAGNAVLNFGRIAQDSAFGFIGVANNIEPFIQSLTTLKRETGSTGSAIKAFFSSLAGPAGVGVLIGAVSLFDAYSKGYGVFAGRAKEAANQQKNFNDEVNQARAGAIATGVELQALIAIVNDSAQSETVRNNALKEVNETTSKYGINLTRANIATGEATKQVEALTNALIAQAVAAKLADRVADLIIRQDAAIQKYAESTRALNEAQQAYTTGGLAAQQAAGGFAQQGTRVTNTSQQLAKAFGTAKDATEEYKTVTQELKDVTRLFNAETVKGLAITQQSTSSTKAAAGAAKELADSLPVEEIQLLFATYNALPRTLTASEAALAAFTAQQLKANEATRVARQLEAGRALAGPQALPTTGIRTTLPIDNTALIEARKELEQVSVLGAAIQQTIPQAFDSIFQSLANGQSAIQSLANVVKGLVVRLLAAAAAAAVLAALTGGASAAGQAVSFGTRFRDLFSGFFGLAKGGIVTGPTTALLGEGGESEVVLPLSQLDRLLSNNGGGGNVQVRGNLRAGDIYISNQRGGASWSRRFG